MVRTILLLAALGLSLVATAVAAPEAAEDFKLTDYEGSVVVVDFWASWCVPCKHSLPWLNLMQKKYGAEGLQVVTVNLDKKPHQAELMAAALVPGIRQFSDPAGDLAERYNLEGLPSSYLYDRNGQLIASQVGFLKSDGDKYEAKIVATLKEK